MGSSQSSYAVQPSASASASASSSSSSREDEVEDHDEPQEQEEDDDEHRQPLERRSRRRRRRKPKPSQLKVLEQEPEILPCRAAASPLSPQPSAAGTPRILTGPSSSIKVWDPCHVLLPPPPPPLPLAFFSRGGGAAAGAAGDRVTEVLLVSHGECAASLRPDLVGGRWADAPGLTARGERQARALAVFLKSQGVRFGEVYSSPLDRARATATLVCRELGFAEDQIQQSDSLIEMSQGQWEGCLLSEVYTSEIINFIDKTQPDFLAPSGESLRQVVFRMIEFLNSTVLRLQEKLVVGDPSIHQNEKELSRNSSTNSVQERDGSQWDLLYRFNRPALQRKKSGKSRLQFVTTGDNETEEEFSPRETTFGSLHNNGKQVDPGSAIGIFTHAIPIKCLLTSLLDCSPLTCHKICIDDSSVTTLQHSLKAGWQIKRINDTAHLRLL